MTIARFVRWLIWLGSAAGAGMMKPLFFPEGGPAYAMAALSFIAVCAILGVVVEKKLSR